MSGVHLLQVVRLADEGEVVFEIVCPAGRGERCPYDDNDPLITPDDWLYCVVADELSNSGPEVIEGEAFGPGPWPVAIRWEGYGDATEAYITLLPDQPTAPLFSATLSV